MNTKLTVISLTLALLPAVGCSKFFSENPPYALPADEFFKDEASLRLYTTNLCEICAPSATEIYQANLVNDLTITYQGNDYLKPNMYSARQANNWTASDWSDLHQINYFLDHMAMAKENVDEARYNHYEGVARMWRAWFYWTKVKTFGDVPYYEHVIDANDTTELYKGRDLREFVMAKVLNDLDFAVNNCVAENWCLNNGYVNKYVALALKSRICLYEGTWLKYRGESGWESWLAESASASEELMNSGQYSLLKTEGGLATDYKKLFVSETTQWSEVIFSNAFSDEFQRYHEATKYFWPGNAGNKTSAARTFIFMYLNRDGSRFTDKDTYWQTEFKDEFAGRDYRLIQSIVGPGYSKTVSGVRSTEWSKLLPNLNQQITFYRPHKWSYDSDATESTGYCTNDLPVFRYAEILLNYAEAKAELGVMDDAVWAKTIALLRERAGVDGTRPTLADPYLMSYYQGVTDCDILEVRRERAVELFLECGGRWDDLMRWKMGDLLDGGATHMKCYKGLYVPEIGTPFDMNGDGKDDLCIYTTAPKDKKSGVTYIPVTADGEFRIDNDQCFNFAILSEWKDYKYLRPVPLAASNINPNLLPQNEGWD